MNATQLGLSDLALLLGPDHPGAEVCMTATKDLDALRASLAAVEAENTTLTAACAAWRDKAERAEAALADAVEHAHGMGQQDAAKRAERAEANWEGTAAEARRLLAENNGLHAALARAREVLREVSYPMCPACGVWRANHDAPHAPDCALAAALEEEP